MVLSTTGNVFIRTLFLGKQRFTGPVKETQRGTLSLLKDKLLPDIVRSFSNRTEQQVTVATYAKNILKEKASGSSTKNFLPSNSPDLDPMDYGIWSQLSDAVFKERIELFSVEELKTRIA